MNAVFFVNEAPEDKRYIIFNSPLGKVMIDSYDSGIYHKHNIYLQNESGEFKYQGYRMLPFGNYPWLCEKIYKECFK